MRVLRSIVFFIISAIPFWVVFLIGLLEGENIFFFHHNVIILYLVVSSSVTIPSLLLLYNYFTKENVTKDSIQNNYGSITVDGEINVLKISLVERNSPTDSFIPVPWTFFYYFEILTEEKTYYLTCLSVKKSFFLNPHIINKSFPKVN